MQFVVLISGAALIGLALSPGLAAAQSAVTQATVRQNLEEAYPVRVLNIEEGEIGGVSAWVVTMMNEGGDFNSAFQVNTVAVNRQTGELIPSFRHGASGYDLPPGSAASPRSEIHPNQMQSGPWR